MENVWDFKYLGDTRSKGGDLISEMEERVKQGRNISGILKAITINGNVSTEMKITLSNSVLLPAVLHSTVVRHEHCLRKRR